MSGLHRVFDVVGASAGLLPFAPAMAAIAAAILIDDGRPVLFRQNRLGYRRGLFEILRFRTMRDGSLTRIGRLLPATGLDEEPQLLNILRELERPVRGVIDLGVLMYSVPSISRARSCAEPCRTNVSWRRSARSLAARSCCSRASGCAHLRAICCCSVRVTWQSGRLSALRPLRL
jgi:hypothetical protein